jgi:hypothetical protein
VVFVFHSDYLHQASQLHGWSIHHLVVRSIGIVGSLLDQEVPTKVLVDLALPGFTDL